MKTLFGVKLEKIYKELKDHNIRKIYLDYPHKAIIIEMKQIEVCRVSDFYNPKYFQLQKQKFLGFRVYVSLELL